MTRPLRVGSLITCLLLSGLGPATQAHATTPVDTAIVSPDITVDLSGTVLDDELVGDDDLAGSVAAVTVGSLPTGSDVDAYYHDSVSGDDLFSVDISVDLGGLTTDRGDVVRFDGVTYTLEFDASAEGVPDGAVTDALATVAGDLLLSFDTTVALGGNTFDDEDLIRFDGAAFTLFFDGSASGVAASLDLDAAHFFESENALALSFDGSGTVGGVAFDDEDVIEYDVGSGTWSMAYDGSGEHAGWQRGDLDGVHMLPEPGSTLMLISGAGFIAVVARRRERTRLGSIA